MTAQPRTFAVKDGVREQVPLLIGAMGPSGGGKTYSALRLASGIQRVTGGDIYGIDTEARRMLHYADHFKFKHIQFDAPFGSLDYLAAVRQCVKAGAGVVIIDSMSHEHEGPGGCLDVHNQELDRLAGDNYGKREAMNFLAWQKPKQARRDMINGLLQINASFIFCFRAKEKMKLVKVRDDDSGKVKTMPVQQGFMPIAGEELVFEMTVNCLLLPHANGVPTWRSDQVGERMMMKLPEQFKSVFVEGAPLSEDIGQQLATWAKGGTISAGLVSDRAAEGEGGDAGHGPPGAQKALPPLSDDEAAAAQLAARKAAEGGVDALQAHWRSLNQPTRRAVQQIMDALKATAKKADDPFAETTVAGTPDKAAATAPAGPVHAAGQKPYGEWTEEDCRAYGRAQFARGMSAKAAVPPPLREDTQRKDWVLAGFHAIEAEKAGEGVPA